MADVQSENVITFDGHESDYLACPVINVWRDYNDRWGKGIAVSVQHGDKGILLERKGDACKVQVGGKVGWLTYYFIKELKQDWQREMSNGIPA